MALRIQAQSRENLSQASKHSKQAQLMRRQPIATTRQPLGSVGNRVAIEGQREGKVNPNRPLHTFKQQHGCLQNVPAAVIPANDKPEPQSNTPQRDVVKEDRCALSTPQPMEVKEVTCELQRKLHLVEDVDEGDRGNITFCADYVKDIYQYLQRLEEEPLYRPDPDYMSRQPSLNHKMRAVLIDWLVLVHIKFSLLPETLFITTNIIDRFLQRQQTCKEQLQLVGVTAMLIASKYEEIFHPTVEDFVYITDNSYSAEDIRCMERLILRRIGYSLASPAPITFLRRFSKIAEVNATIHSMAKFLLDLAMVDYGMLQFLPSQQAAAALCISLRLYTDHTTRWDASLEHYTRYTETDLLPCMQKLAQLVVRMPIVKQQAVREKYSSRRFLRVAREPALFGMTIKELAAQGK